MKYPFKINKTNEELVVTGKSEESLDRLLSVCDPKDIILCGGLVINHHLQKNSLSVPSVIGQDDIDMKVMDLKTLRKVLGQAKESFHISHYHDYAKKKGDYLHIDRFFGGLVDKKNNVKVDIFDIENFIPQELDEFKYKGKKILARSLEDQVVTKMFETYRILGMSCRENAINPKQLPELYWLVSISNPLKIQKLWVEHPYHNTLRDTFPTNFPPTFEEAYTQALSWMYHHPEIVEKSKKKDTEKYKKSCPECTEDPNFPLKSK